MAKVILPDLKFTGREDIREFIREFRLYVELNEWGDDKAAKYLAVFLKEEAKDFYHQQIDEVKNSFESLVGALLDRFEGGLALLKYKKDFNSRSRQNGEPLHSYLSALRLLYDKANKAPIVQPLTEDPSTAERVKNSEQKATLEYYNHRRDEDILCQFVNGLNIESREVLIRQDDLLQTPVETIVKRLANLEEERKALKDEGKVSVKGTQVVDKDDSNLDKMVEERIDAKLKELMTNKPRQTPVAAVRRGGKRVPFQQQGPKPTDVCRACNGRGHWARNCPSLNVEKAGQGPRYQP